jgi:hypothetical protein
MSLIKLILIFSVVVNFSEIVSPSKIAIFGPQNVIWNKEYQVVVLGVAGESGEVKDNYEISFICGGSIQDSTELEVDSKTETSKRFLVGILILT